MEAIAESIPANGNDPSRYLVSERVKLWQFYPGFYDRDVLYRLWQLVEDSGDMKRLMHWEFSMVPKTPHDSRGDLASFVRYFTGPIMLTIVEVDGKLAGFYWLSDVLMPWKACVGVFFAKSFRGRDSRLAGVMFRKYITEYLGFQSIWAYTPWENVCRYAEELGMRLVAVLPGAQIIEEKPMDLFVLKLEAGNG